MVGFEVQKAVIMKIGVFWHMTPCMLVDTDQHLGGNCCKYRKESKMYNNGENGGGTGPLNIGTYLPNHTVSRSKKQ
jgi:hypothetical protein